MSVRCCGEADESNGAEHAVWCHNYDLAKGFAAARREGWAQAIEALREHDAEIRAELTNDEGRLDWESYEPTYDLAADYLTDRAAALTEEGGQ